MSGGAAPRSPPLFGRSYLTWLLVLLFLLNTLNFADRAILSALAEAVKRDLAISDFQLGLLQGLGFALLYATLGLPIARWAERGSRVRTVALAAGVWSLFAAMCGMAGSFIALLLCRVGVGVGEAGFNPPVASLVGDHFVAARRASIMALIGLGGAVGPMLGALGGGWIGDHYGWRTAFVVIGSPGLILGPLVWFTLRDPPRGHAEGLSLDGPPPPFGKTLRTLLAKPAFRHLLFAGALASMGTNAIGQFLGVYLVRAFGLSFTQAGALFGTVSAIAVPVGLLVGGFGIDWLGRRDRRWLPWGSAIATALSAPAFALAFFQAGAGGATLFFALGSTFLFLYYGPALAMVQELAPPRMRATAAFVNAFTLGMIGLGLGPALVGLVSDWAGARAFAGDYALCRGAAPGPACIAASAMGIRFALRIACGLFLWAALHFLLAARSFRTDRFDPERKDGVA
jgi:MFS family permease